jgi:hypothetical protein
VSQLSGNDEYKKVHKEDFFQSSSLYSKQRTLKKKRLFEQACPSKLSRFPVLSVWIILVIFCWIETGHLDWWDWKGSSDTFKLWLEKSFRQFKLIMLLYVVSTFPKRKTSISSFQTWFFLNCFLDTVASHNQLLFLYLNHFLLKALPTLTFLLLFIALSVNFFEYVFLGLI